MPPEVHPAIAKKIEELWAKAKELVAAQQQNLDILSKTIDIKDLHGVKMRLVEVLDCSNKMQWVSGQLDALRDLPYDMAAEAMGPKRRSSAQAMPAVTAPPVEKPEPESK
jgi:hypothetical protein